MGGLFAQSWLNFFSCRLEMIKERERQKAEEVEAVKRSLMQNGMVRKILVFLILTGHLLVYFAVPFYDSVYN
jgi:hypothetical protein